MTSPLEEQPLQLLNLPPWAPRRNRMLEIVLLHQVGQNRIALKDGEIVIGVVDESRDSAVRVERGILCVFMLAFGEVEVDSAVGERERFEDIDDSPAVGACSAR